MRKLDSIKDTKTREKSNLLESKISKCIYSKNSIEEGLKLNAFNESINSVGKSFSDCRSRRDKKRLDAKLNESKCFNIKAEALSEAFSELAYSSIPLSEEEENEYGEKIKKLYKESYLNMMEKGILNSKNPSIFYEDYVQPLVSTFNFIDANINNHPDEIVNKLNNASIVMENSDIKNAIAENVRNKLLTVVKEEKFISNNRTKLISENKRYDGKSLFNGLSVYCYNENKDKFLEGKEDGYVLTEEDENNLAESSLFGGTIIYNMLECLHTCNLVEGLNNYDTVQKLISSLYA